MSTILDLSQLEEIYGADKGGLQQLLADVLTAATRLVARIEAASASGSLSEMRLHLHELVGMCLATGCVDLAEAGSRLTASLRDGVHGEVPDAIEQLGAAFGRIRSLLADLVVPLLSAA